jgi:hypothetical protein
MSIRLCARNGRPLWGSFHRAKSRDGLQWPVDSEDRLKLITNRALVFSAPAPAIRTISPGAGSAAVRAIWIDFISGLS